MTCVHTIEKSGRSPRRLAMGALALSLALLVAACILSPGKFTSTLDLKKDRSFRFVYQGELYFLSASDLAKKSKDGKEKADEARQMSTMMGGMDMDDPKVAAEFAHSLERQAGWRKVTYMGKGLFDVDYEISGTLTHDFTFPVIEGFPMANPFVRIILRQDGSARVDAPGFSSGASGGPLKAMANMGAMEKAKDAKQEAPEFPKMDGTFTLTTDGDILTNNTADGPAQVMNGAARQLFWPVNDRTAQEPTALIRLSD